jgi:hypothetical protein
MEDNGEPVSLIASEIHIIPKTRLAKVDVPGQVARVVRMGFCRD